MFAAIAGEDVVERVAGTIDVGRPGQRQVLDAADGMDRVGKAEAHRGLNRVRAVATGLVDHVARIVDHIGVVARAAEHRVGTGTAIESIVAAKPGQDIRAAIADEDVVEIVAGTIDVGRPGQRQVLDAAQGMNRVGKAEGDRRLNQVNTVATGLVNHVAGIVDHIGVVARATEHRVGTGTAIQRVVAAKAGQDIRAAIADEDVVEIVAGRVDGARPGQRQVLDAADGMHRVGKAEARSRPEPGPYRRHRSR